MKFSNDISHSTIEYLIWRTPFKTQIDALKKIILLFHKILLYAICETKNDPGEAFKVYLNSAQQTNIGLYNHTLFEYSSFLIPLFIDIVKKYNLDENKKINITLDKNIIDVPNTTTKIEHLQDFQLKEA